MSGVKPSPLVCGVPHGSDTIQLAHGGGGRRMSQLIEQLIRPAFDPSVEAAPWVRDTRHDSAALDLASGRLALTSDSYVVNPLFFPGGDIGRLAVYGTLNDLAMAGACPKGLTLSLILEEGLPLQTLRRVLESAGRAALDAGVPIISGDTKVVERGKADGLFINTSGVGERSDQWIHPSAIQPGDAVMLLGDIGRHGIAILCARQELHLESEVESDCRNLWPAIEALLSAGVELHCLRDCTRGGLASACLELAAQSSSSFCLEESNIPVQPAVQNAAELLGFDPLYIASEGACVLILPAEAAEAAKLVLGGALTHIGSVTTGGTERPGEVSVRSPFGSSRLLTLLSGEQLPRIC
ncbi:MAG: hydrogenase expression/formation protein HypE [Myxococcales bacterium]|nr:hydrogenase expression/formation protein HypE [Myxococcales bacterium]